MKKILFLLPALLMLVGCDNTKTYVVGEDAICFFCRFFIWGVIFCPFWLSNIVNLL